MIEKLVISLGEISWAISLVAAIPLAVLANLITPHVESVLSRKTKLIAKNRAQILECELCEAKTASENLNKVYLNTFIIIILLLMFFVISSIIIAIPGLQMITIPLSCIVFISFFEFIWKHLKLLVRIRDIEKYEEETNKAITRLRDKAMPPPENKN